MKLTQFRNVLLAVICGIAFSAATPADAQKLIFKVTADKTQVALDDVVVLAFAIQGDALNTSVTPELPDLAQDFDVLQGPSRSTNISIINGKQSSSVIIQYVLAPKQAGEFTIPPATLTYDNTTYTTEPVVIEVVSGAVAPAQTPDGADSAAQAGQDVFLQAELDKTTAYIGEQMTVSFFVYTRVNIAGYNLQQQPQFTGFWVEELPIPNPPKLQYQTINGQQYGVALLKKVALFPTASGAQNIDALTMTFSVKVRGRSNDPFDNFFDDPFFARTEEVIRRTQPVAITILPLPEEQRPASFHGDVGSFSMAVEAAPQSVKQDDAMTLTVKIQGIGNIKTLKEPEIKLPEAFKRYDTNVTEKPFPLQEPLQGEKTFETIIIPTAAGDYTLPPVEFAYFDPQRKSYQTLRSQPIALTVQPKVAPDEPLARRITTKEAIKLLGQDLRFIKTDVAALTEQGRRWYHHDGVGLLVVAPLLLIAAAWGYQRYQRQYAGDARYVRQKRAGQVARHSLKQAQEWMQQGRSGEFYAAIASALRQYLGAKLNLPPASLQTAELKDVLAAAGLEAATFEELQRCLAQCDFARFAPVEARPEEMQAILDQATALLAQFARLQFAKIQTSAAPLFGGILLAILLMAHPASSADVPVTERFQQGNTFYEQGQYAEAAAAYQAIVATGLHNGAVYYNLGNALLKADQLGAAILFLERARRLLPRDEDVAFNLQYARSQTLDKLEEQAASPFLTLLVTIRDALTFSELSALAFGLYWLLSGLIIALLVAPNRMRRRLVWFGILPVVGFLLLTGMVLMAQWRAAAADEAILLATQAEAKTGPGASYSTLFEIHAGAKVVIQREKQDWVEIKLPNNVIGWIMQKDLERIQP